MLRLLLMTDTGPQHPDEVCLGIIQITNAPGGTPERGNYDVNLFAPTGMLLSQAQLTEVLRGQGEWVLASKALRALFS